MQNGHKYRETCFLRKNDSTVSVTGTIFLQRYGTCMELSNLLPKELPEYSGSDLKGGLRKYKEKEHTPRHKESWHRAVIKIMCATVKNATAL